MDEWRGREERATNVLYQQAVRVPLPDLDAERVLHKNMTRIADAGIHKSDLLADPDVPLTEAYEYELDEMRQSFQHRLQQVAGADYHDVADAYIRGERDDWIGALATYYRECYYRLQERYTHDDQFFFLLVLRYPDCFTVNLGFADGDVSDDAVRYESVTHTDIDEEYRERYYAECQYAQREAAEYIRERVACIRESFPDPDTTPFEERNYGGFVHITGRSSAIFSELLDSVRPDPGRFDSPVTTPGLVPEGPEAKRTKRKYLADADFVA
ncbi:hypothetical protein [Halobellus sp. H-GB7]|uniref:hypothetical protein n=1 Tax=Halobellus sp. H-GB7 TaxID=3069756 RepID=UPI0027B468BC|nr:hypothetical protein [Halobellus sp. H-GB7]MDQ2053185.1 hypothetical protein [Halobellus sp. H-GB7]